MKRLRLRLISSLVVVILSWAAPVGAAPPAHAPAQGPITPVVQPGEKLWAEIGTPVSIRY
jgi:hypothetical protein